MNIDQHQTDKQWCIEQGYEGIVHYLTSVSSKYRLDIALVRSAYVLAQEKDGIRDTIYILKLFGKIKEGE